MCALVAIASRGEKILFKVSTGLVLIKLCTVALLGVMMIEKWDVANVGSIPETGAGLKDAIELLPFTLTSILFIQSLSPMVISYRSKKNRLRLLALKPCAQ